MKKVLNVILAGCFFILLCLAFYAPIDIGDVVKVKYYTVYPNQQISPEWIDGKIAHIENDVYSFSLPSKGVIYEMDELMLSNNVIFIDRHNYFVYAVVVLALLLLNNILFKMKVIEGDYVRFILDDSLVVEGIVVNVHDKNNIGVKVMDCSYKPSIGKIFRVNIKRTKNFKKLKYELT